MTNPLNFWFEQWFKSRLVARSVAILALVNFLLVVFDLSYIPLRDFWLQGKVRLGNFKIGPLKSEGITIKVLPPSVSQFITQYDVIKDIEPYRDTDEYLKLVNKLENNLNNINSPATTKILEELRDRSENMIETNPFQRANKTGTLEKIKNLMRQQVPNTKDSSKQAFEIFWNPAYFKNYPQEKLQFFDQKIRPLMATNYFRPYGENGRFVDNFGLIDFPFFVIFLFDFLGRSLSISRRHVGVRWIDGMLWRWYDIFLLIPLFRWLRIIPVIVRLNESQLINLYSIKKQASQGFVANIAEDLTEVVVIRVINQLQDSIRQGEIAKLFTQRQIHSYVDINNIDEATEIFKLMVALIVEQVLPKVQSDFEALVQYNLDKSFNQLPLYSRIHQIPGIDKIQTQLIKQLSSQIYQTLSNALASLLKEDPVFKERLERLIENFNQTLGTQMQAKQSIVKLESLLADWLEEIKINYVERASKEDIEKILEQTRVLRQVAQTSPQLNSFLGREQGTGNRKQN